jgi:hypothetical protein
MLAYITYLQELKRSDADVAIPAPEVGTALA